jgi:predicted naringenin-chalcone synthase
LSKIIAIGTAVPAYCHQQETILHFMQNVYGMNEVEKRKIKFLYHQSGIDTRYSVINDYSKPPDEWKFYPASEVLEPFPNLELRMAWYSKYAPPLSVDAIRECIAGKISASEITHLITVSCTGMSAPGLDLQVMELLDLPTNIYRTSVNFMGCYAAIHALKIADGICQQYPLAKVIIVCTELCTLHFQKEATADSISASLLFADGSAAVLVTNDQYQCQDKSLHIDDFYAEVVAKGKRDMAWELSSTGFLMTLSGYIPALIEEDFEALVTRALTHAGKSKQQITHWCIHPGGRRIVDAIAKSLQLSTNAFTHSYEVLKRYGNMSSPTILFVLKEIMLQTTTQQTRQVLGAAFGPGLTMETISLSS